MLWGRAHESGGAPPYWPWVSAIRSLVTAVEPDTLRSQLGSGASDGGIGRLRVRERLPDIGEVERIDDPEVAQFRLYDAVTSFLRNASASTPLVVVLDDLHWADKPTLLLLQHAAREIGRSRLLIVWDLPRH